MVSKTVVGISGEIKDDKNQFHFCHADVKENDVLMVLLESGLSMDRSDILHAIRKVSRGK
jgi:uncharacterized phosphosugar-binding protein